MMPYFVSKLVFYLPECEIVLVMSVTVRLNSLRLVLRLQPVSGSAG